MLLLAFSNLCSNPFIVHDVEKHYIVSVNIYI